MTRRRTTLLPIDTPTLEPPPLAAAAESAPEAARAQWNPLFVRSVIVGVAVLLLVGGLILSTTRPTAPQATAQLLATPLVESCPSVASFLEVIASYERQARWGLAATTAQTALRTPGLCAPDRASLGQKTVSLGREALFEQPPAPEDAPGQRRVAVAYADLKTLATRYGAPLPAPLPIAQSAYDNRLFLLATVAFADAFADGDTSPQDRQVVRADYAAHYNLGLIWSQRADLTQRQEGLARLATACRIDERQQLSSPEACDKLQMLIGPRSKWPLPLADPLIDAPSPPAVPAGGL